MKHNEKFRYIIIIMWAMLFCLNLLFCLTTSEPTPFSWALVGFPFGVFLALLINNPLLNIQDDLIELQRKIIKIDMKKGKKK